MPQRRNNPNNPFVSRGGPSRPQVDDQPWNKSQMEVEPMPNMPVAPVAPTAPIQGPEERPDASIIAPTSPSQLRDWRRGIKKA